MKISRLIPIIAFVIILILNVTFCTKKTSIESSETLLETDRSYSALSVKQGMNASFLAMFDSSGVKLQTNHPPIVGYENIKAFLMSGNDSSFTLTWEPMIAKLAASGDMGYTYGIYKITDKATDSITGQGTYVTIWGKNRNGQWKALLDTGNEGLGTANNSK
ncbi:MAG: YybH family protein [Bacteroidales bacterium]